MGLRRQAREVALQGVFMCDFLSKWDNVQLAFCFDHFGILTSVRPYAERLAAGVVQNIAKIDSELTCASEHWSISRMSRVDRGILRVAAFEILFLEDVPHSVAINEAIEIAKRFGSDESPSFVNGVLDKLAANHSLSKGVVRERAPRPKQEVPAAPPAEVLEKILVR